MKILLPLLSLMIFQTEANAAWWASALQCDNGAARVEVDLGERRDVQLVVEDPQIRRHLERLTVNPNYSRVIVGRTNNGIFRSSDFRGFLRQGGSPTCHSGYAPTIKVYREGRGLKITVHQEAAEGCCWERDSAGHCTNKSADVPYKYLGDWYLQSCEEVQIPN
jgi:hypothetical protein